jgi:hypothetical protein
MPFLGTTGGGSVKQYGGLANLGYFIKNSLRFRSSASAYLNRTPATATNRKTFTWSGWVKRSNPSTTNTMLAADVDANNFFAIWFREEGDNGRLEILNYSSAYDLQIETTQVFRDVSAWYHVVVAIDTTQATSTNRVKIYINGSQVTALSTTTYPSLNFDTDVNTINPHKIGVQGSSYGLHNGYLAEINFIDGQALTPSSFGKTDAATGQWIPKKFAGTYGTNGFYLKFADASAATAAAIGKDSSPNGNNWTPNNISVTAGVTYDAMIDSPTLSGAASNYCVLNPLFTDQTGVASSYGGPAPTISNANLTATAIATSLQAAAVCTVGVSTGKWYFEYTPSATNGSGDIVGFVCAFSGGLAFAGYRSTGQIYTNGSSTAGYATWTAGDVIGIALSIDGSTISAYKNNALQATLSLTTAITNNCFPVIWFRDDAGAGSFNFGQRPFQYSAPSGFLSLNTFNLP